MKKQEWILYVLVFITSSTTVLTLFDGSFLGLLRGLAIAAVLDGSIIYHERNANTLKDATQRKWSNGMKWAAIGFLLVIAVAYVLTLFVPVGAIQQVDLFGMEFASTIQEVIHWTVYAMIGAWVVLTLGVVVYLREIDPDLKRERERKIAGDEAIKQQQDKEDSAFRTAMDAVAELTGTEKGLKQFEERLIAAGYKEYERQQLLAIAKNKLIEEKTGSLPVNTNDLFVNKFGAATKDETANFTKPPTSQK